MAKAKNLAGLAALGALGYMLTKGKSKDDAGDQTSSSYSPSSTATKTEDEVTNESAYSPRSNMTPLQGVGDATSGPMVKSKTRSLAAADRTTGSPDSEAGMSRGTRAADARSAEAGMSRGTRKTSVAGAGRGSINPGSVAASDARASEAGASRGTRTTSTAGAGRGSVNPASVKPSGPRDMEAGMSRGTRTPAPPFKGGQSGYDEAGNFLGGSRGYDEAGNPMKKGGKVKKMASGGMTSKVSSASKRADGIASRGKTNCKMY